MFIIPKIKGGPLEAIKTFNKILNPKDHRHYVKFIYCTGENGRLLFCDAKALFAINTEFEIEKGYHTLSKVGADYALIPSTDVTPEKYEYPQHEDLFSMCEELIENHYDINFSESWSLSSAFIKFSHLLSASDHIHIIDLKYFQMLPEVTYELFIDRKDGKPFATHFKNMTYEAIIMPIAM